MIIVFVVCLTENYFFEFKNPSFSTSVHGSSDGFLELNCPALISMNTPVYVIVNTNETLKSLIG